MHLARAASTDKSVMLGRISGSRGQCLAALASRLMQRISTGDFHQYDVSDPFKPKLTGKLRIGGIVSRAPHPKSREPPPQMVEVSRDGRRIYITNSLYSAVDGQLYPDGIKGWMVKVNAKPEGGIELDEDFFLSWPEGYLPHQVRLQGGDASSDSYCYP